METTEEVGVSVEVAVEIQPVQREIAYTITDAYFPTLHVIKSLNAWWMDRRKVERLIEAFKAGHMVKTACVYAGITRGEWNYFNEMHPVFSDVREACEENQTLGFMNTINANKDDPATARWYMEKTHPKFNPKKVGEGQLLQPTVNVAIGANIDAGTITAAIRAIAHEIFSPARGGSIADTQRAGSAVAGESEG